MGERIDTPIGTCPECDRPSDAATEDLVCSTCRASERRDILAAIGEAVVRYLAPPDAGDLAVRHATVAEVMEWVAESVVSGDGPPPEQITDAVHAAEPRFCRTDADLLRWVIEHAGDDSPHVAPRWAHVRDLLGVGSTVAGLLCVAAGVDPDDEVPRDTGDREECEECGATGEAP